MTLNRGGARGGRRRTGNAICAATTTARIWFLAFRAATLQRPFPSAPLAIPFGARAARLSLRARIARLSLRAPHCVSLSEPASLSQSPHCARPSRRSAGGERRCPRLRPAPRPLLRPSRTPAAFKRPTPQSSSAAFTPCPLGAAEKRAAKTATRERSLITREPSTAHQTDCSLLVGPSLHGSAMTAHGSKPAREAATNGASHRGRPLPSRPRRAGQAQLDAAAHDGGLLPRGAEQLGVSRRTRAHKDVQHMGSMAIENISSGQSELSNIDFPVVRSSLVVRCQKGR